MRAGLDSEVSRKPQQLRPSSAGIVERKCKPCRKSNGSRITPPCASNKSDMLVQHATKPELRRMRGNSVWLILNEHALEEQLLYPAVGFMQLIYCYQVACGSQLVHPAKKTLGGY